MSNLGAAGNLDKDRLVIVIEVLTSSIDVNVAEVFAIEEEGLTWFTPMWNFLMTEVLPGNQLEARKLKKIAPLYSIFDNQLYKRGYLRSWLKCLTEDKVKEMLAETHAGICGSHQGTKTLAKRVLRAGFYWPTIHQDAADLVRKCEQCQFHSKLGNISAYERVNISEAWPFDLWGIDIVGPFPKAIRQRRWIVVAVKYFTKWVKTEALATITTVAIEKFI